ncbi:MAG TPA: hypothetical protein VGF77_03125 [Allosphingosinicella sp.]|jgi:uncharacterized membrane protein
MPDAAESDFELVKYERDREHELALNEFTHRLEVEQLKLLILLNGGAATALLAFAEHDSAAVRWLAVPVVLWLAGLVAGALATMRMRKAQAFYGKFYRHRRQVTEFLRLAGRRKLPPSLSIEDRKDLETLAETQAAVAAALATENLPGLHASLAEIAIAKARTGNEGVTPLSHASLCAFLAGALAAAAVMILVPPAETAKPAAPQLSAPAR